MERIVSLDTLRMSDVARELGIRRWSAPEMRRLMEQGIDSVSLNPDTVVETWLYLGKSVG